MNTSRREFLKTSTVVGGGLLLGVSLPRIVSRAQAAGTVHTPNAWVHIADDNTITLLSARSEMGQGVYTSMPMLIAEELNVDLKQIKVAVAPPNAAAYGNALLGGAQVTGGSASVRDGWEKLRVGGAQVRTMLISAAASKWGVPASSCRAENGVVTSGAKRATYGELAEAASKLPVPKDVTLKDPKDFRIVGKPTKRLDTPAKINGTAEFGIDVQLPGMVFASVEQCPVIGGKVKSLDAAKAKAMPGVIDVVQIDDGVAVVARSYWQAQKARAALNVQWDEGPGAAISNAAMMSGIRQAAANEKVIGIKSSGDATAAFASAARTHKAEYESPLLAHATMEPMNFTADFRNGKLLLIGPTQFQGMQAVAAGLLGLKPEDVTLKTTFLGCGLGRRFEMDIVMQAVQTSKAVGRPVKVIWTREDDTRHDFYRPMALHRMAAALDANGNPVAATFQLTSQSVTERAFPDFAPVGKVDPFMAESAITPYAIPHQMHEMIRHDAGLRVGYWRSVSHALNAFANESFIDELAVLAKKDPYAYRMALLAGKPRVAAVLKKAAEKAGWSRPPAAGRARGIAVLDSEYGSALAQVIEISMPGGAIKVERIVVAADLGRMVNPDTVEAQIQSSVAFGLSAALHSEITLKNGRVQQGNFDTYPILRIGEMPPMDVILVDSTEAPGGIGEPGTALVGPALANAVFAATGKRVRKLPLTPENIARA